MEFQIVVSCASNQIVSRGRLVCRCYRRTNKAEAFGREPGQLACIGCQSVKNGDGSIDYHVTLVDVADLTDPRATNGESSDFSALAPDWTQESAFPAASLPSLSWAPLTPEGQT